MTNRAPARTGRIAVAMLAVAALTILAVTPTLGVKAGNNGTVKVHDGSGEPAPLIKNDPKVCTFHFDFFFGDEGQTGLWWVESWSPGGDGSVVLDGSYATDAEGHDRQPTTGSFELPDGHYKLFWEGAENPGGNTNLKHKVFGVDCGDTDPPGGG